MIRFVDGFDYITVANGARKWDNATGTIVSGFAGIGSALQGAVVKTKTLPASYSTGFASFHFYTGTLSSCAILSFLDSNTTQCELRMSGTGALSFTRNGTLLGSASTSTLSANTWYWICVKVVINDTTGTAQVKVDNVSFVSLTSQDTKNTSNATFNQVVIDTNSGRTQIHDNFIFWDDTSGSGNDLSGFPTGAVTVDTAWVTGAGDNADWTPSAGSNYQNVDETNANDDTDYNSSATANQVDTYAMGNLHATSATVLAIAVNTIDRIDDATLRTVSHRLKSSSATADGTAFGPSGSYQNHQTIFTLDPNTSAAPTVSARNAMKAGVKLVS